MDSVGRKRVFYAASTPTTGSGSSSTLILIYLALFGAFYFLYLRPRAKKQKQQRQEARQVDVGDKAQTVGGFIGTVVRKSNDVVTLRAASGAELDFVIQAIARKYVEPSAPDTSSESND
jgi:preprotein translocase subunit YajC